MELYVKECNNCQSLPLTIFEELSPTWRGDRVRIRFGETIQEYHDIVGINSLIGTGPTSAVYVTHVQAPSGERGYLIYGGNHGVRILDDEAQPLEGIDDYLPRGYGKPVCWVSEEDLADLPDEVQAVVSRPR